MGSWWVVLVHGGVNVTMIALAGRELWRLREWEGNWSGARSKWVAVGGPPSASEPNRLTAAPNVDDHVTQLVGELRQTSAQPARVALLNEATAEFESRLGFFRVGAIGWRVCAASGVGWGCLVVVENLALAATYLGSGVVGAVLTWNLGRMADSRARRLRERWNGLIRRLSRSFPESETFGVCPPTMQCGADERG